MAEIKDFARMCKSHTCTIECPMRKKAMTKSCTDYMSKYPDESDRIITEWCKEHPQKTYAQDFFEKFPNAPKSCDGLPDPTACSVYGYSKPFEKHCESGVDCVSCWNEVMEE